MEPNLFRRQVLDEINLGGAGIPQGISAFTGPGGDFENIPANRVRAFIVTPNRRGVNNPALDDIEFPYEIGKIRDTLHNILGREDEALYVLFYPQLLSRKGSNAPTEFLT